MKGFRYLLYIGFALAAVTSWALFAFFVLGWVPFGDPACSFEPSGCPPPTGWQELFSLLVAYGAIPATVLVFVFYRRWERRKFGMDD